MIELRDFENGEEEALWEVYYSSIHLVCSKDYTEEQINAWAPANLDPILWRDRIRGIKPFVALIDGKIVGYSDLQGDGLIDHFFVHGNYQRKGVGHRLMSEILKRGVTKEKLHSEVSHTAKPLYEKFGFELVREQTVEMRGVQLTNNIMERVRTPSS